MNHSNVVRYSPFSNPLSKFYRLGLPMLIATVVGCSSQPDSSSESSALLLNSRQAELDERERNLQAREQALTESANEMSTENSFATASVEGDELLPPNAKVGECYARVWVEPRYETVSNEIKVKDQSEQINLIPAQYEWAEESVLVKEASSRIETIPATYRTEKEVMLIKESRNSWRTNRNVGSPPAGDKLLAAAQAGGINLEAATPGMCFHEHFVPAQYETITEDVLASEAATKFEAMPAQYEWVEEQVQVSSASFRIEEVPAVFETETETVLDKPAHTTWKKGTGPVQRIDQATGEIMCLVEVPATYKTVSKRVLISPATTRRVEIPATYETVKVRKLIAPAGQREIEIPASYKTVTRTNLIADEKFIWHEISDNSMSADSRTGSTICLVNEPAEYRSVSRQVVDQAASTRTVEIPAVYETVNVKKLVSEAREERLEIPAVFKTVTSQRLIEDGYMEWRSILCETNMTTDRISAIQQALADQGYDPGPIDGVIGTQTIAAVNQFQRDKSLPVDRYLNIDTLNALGVSPR